MNNTEQIEGYEELPENWKDVFLKVRKAHFKCLNTYANNYYIACKVSLATIPKKVIKAEYEDYKTGVLHYWYYDKAGFWH